MFGELKNEAKVLAILVLAILATVVNSTVYIISFLTDGCFAAAIVWIAYSIIKTPRNTP